MVNYSIGAAALLSVVDLVVASDVTTSAAANKRGGRPSARGRDAGGKGLRRRDLQEETGWDAPTFYPTPSPSRLTQKIYEDWTEPGWQPDGWEKPVLCEKKVSDEKAARAGRCFVFVCVRPEGVSRARASPSSSSSSPSSMLR